MPDLDPRTSTVISLGPLDAFADWFARSGFSGRVIAISSTGRNDKMQSSDPDERALALRLQAAERKLRDAGEGAGATLTILRPTLLYGGNLDRSLSALVQAGSQLGFLPLPFSARGMRQPVHVEDVAAAVTSCLERPASIGQSIDIPGGEALRFDRMVQRTLARRAPGCRVIRVPGTLFAVGLMLARKSGRQVPGPGTVHRWRQDQSADLEPAERLIGFDPRPFQP